MTLYVYLLCFDSYLLILISKKCNLLTKSKQTLFLKGVNLTDPMFRGIYRGKAKHEDDLMMVLNRAWDAGVTSIIITGIGVIIC